MIIDSCQSGGALDALGRVADARIAHELRLAESGRAPNGQPDHGVGLYLFASASPLQVLNMPQSGPSRLAASLVAAALEEETKRGGAVWVRSLLAEAQKAMAASP